MTEAALEPVVTMRDTVAVTKGTTMTTAAQLAETYFTAWTAGDFDTLRSILADDCTFARPLAVIDNADDCVAGLQGMSEIVTDIVVATRLAADHDVIIWFDLHTSIAPPTPTAKWSRVEDDRIMRIA